MELDENTKRKLGYVKMQRYGVKTQHSVNEKSNKKQNTEIKYKPYPKVWRSKNNKEKSK